MCGGRAAMAALLVGGLALAGCAADPNGFYPDTESGRKILEQRALANVPARYRPTSVTVVREYGRRFGGDFGAAWGGLSVGSGLGDTDVVGYDAWVRVEGCKGHVLVRFDRWGDVRTVGDLTKDCGR
ncbi:hypothetical protein GCM10017083_00550 [Thalassobaculum fulvum]|uniref:Lipoprotein n=2 Tax=Thalassobaculum fulvum TaxID=1633335 RepID=A0A918XMM4_9PROT|nr:hypothetical protein GCM10017083_00550 [Thalassobaculum fulvum]